MPVPKRLRYLQYSRRVHGILIPVCALCAAGSAFIAVCAFVPQFAAILHLGPPAIDGMNDVFAFSLFFSITLFFATMFAVLFVTREMLASYWLLNFMSFLPPGTTTPPSAALIRDGRRSPLSWGRGLG